MFSTLHLGMGVDRLLQFSVGAQFVERAGDHDSAVMQVEYYKWLVESRRKNQILLVHLYEFGEARIVDKR